MLNKPAPPHVLKLREEIKAKIAALKAKTVNAGCTEAEALAAAEMAAKLMSAHGINEAEIEFITASARIPLSIPVWQRGLIAAICRATGAHAISIQGDIRKIEFSGREHVVEVALYLRDVLTRAVNAEIKALRATAGYRRLRKATSKSGMISSFALGMVARLSVKLHELFANQTNKADRDTAKALLESKYADAKTAKTRSVSIKNSDAYWAGKRAADAVQISHGVSGKAPPRMIAGGQ